MAQPRQPDYWEADASGQLALKPLPLPFPLCHTYVNHKYKVIFIIHPKRWVRTQRHRWGAPSVGPTAPSHPLPVCTAGPHVLVPAPWGASLSLACTRVPAERGVPGTFSSPSNRPSHPLILLLLILLPLACLFLQRLDRHQALHDPVPAEPD